MPFEKFKAKHGGSGPFAAFYDVLTDGQGIFGRRGIKGERALTDSLIESVQSDDRLGLSEVAEQGRSRMTAEEHADFRADLTQAVLTQRTLDAGVDSFNRSMVGLRARADNEDELGSLDLMQANGDYAFRLLRSQDPALKAQGAQLMSSVMANQAQFSTTLEDRRIQLEESEKAGRETARKEFQDQLNSQIFAPMIQDRAAYASLASQISRGNAADVAPPSLVSAVLEYSGAALRQSDDGNWSFSIGPLGISDTNLPAMTYSEIRNRLNDAHRGHDESLSGVMANYAELAKTRGLQINGSRVDDLVFPLANATYARREQEFRPPPKDPETVQTAVESGVKNVENVVEGFGRGAMPNFVRGVSDALEWMFTEPPPPVTYRNPRRAASGVIDRSAYDRLPTND